MICCRYFEILFASPEPIETVRNVSIILSGIFSYWLGAAVRLSFAGAPQRRWLAHSVIAVLVSLMVVPPLLFMASQARDPGTFVAALAAGFACGTVLNQAALSHLDSLGFSL